MYTRSRQDSRISNYNLINLFQGEKVDLKYFCNQNFFLGKTSFMIYVEFVKLFFNNLFTNGPFFPC